MCSVAFKCIKQLSKFINDLFYNNNITTVLSKTVKWILGLKSTWMFLLKKKRRTCRDGLITIPRLNFTKSQNHREISHKSITQHNNYFVTNPPPFFFFPNIGGFSIRLKYHVNRLNIITKSPTIRKYHRNPN